MSQFLKGADVSFVLEIEEAGGKYFVGDEEKDVLEILKESGVNSIRLRIWKDPEVAYHNLEKTVQMAKRAKALGFHFLLDFHYSDYWADPGKQFKPKAWEGLSFPDLEKALEQYTHEVILELKNEGALPDMVQIGNEITNGMVWDDGRVQGEFDSDENWEKFTRLLKAGIRGLEQALDPEDDVKTMLHIDRGADNEGSRKFYDKMEQFGVNYDMIGLSFYPWWHGTIEDLENNMNDLASRYGKDIIVAEVAYPWFIPDSDEGFAFTKNDKIVEGYPATVEGQGRYLQDLMELIRKVPGNRGVGMYYWEPCWIPSKEEWSVGHENNWANLTLFDNSGRKLDSLNAFRS